MLKVIEKKEKKKEETAPGARSSQQSRKDSSGKVSGKCSQGSELLARLQCLGANECKGAFISISAAYLLCHIYLLTEPSYLYTYLVYKYTIGRVKGGMSFVCLHFIVFKPLHRAIEIFNLGSELQQYQNGQETIPLIKCQLYR